MKPFGPYLDGYHDIADQLATHLRDRAAAAFARTDQEKAAIATPEAFEARRARLRARMLESIGGLPDLPTTVQATATGRLEHPAFTIDKLLLETLPGVLATANLYLPRHAETPFPAVLFLCGHARAAKAYPPYQRVCRALAEAGMAVLALDPVGQGERLQYLDPQTGAERVGWGTTEHSYAGFQCTVAGFGIARYFIADAMAALTYLAARPEVDPSRLGVTGNSGGGTQASYLIFLDERLACGAPCTYITGRRDYMATGQPHDAEQNIWQAIEMGLDYDDLASGLAPKPLLLGAAASDFFCIEGTVAAYDHLRRMYALYGRAQDLYLAVAPGTHGFSDVLRELVVRFFARHLLGEAVDLPRGIVSCAGADESPLGEAFDCTAGKAAPAGDRPPEDLQVTDRGQVVLDHPQAKTVFDLNLAAWRQRPGAPDAIRRAVLADRPRLPLWVREIAQGKRYMFTEPGIAVPMLLLPGQGDGALQVVAWPQGTAGVESRRDDVAALCLRGPLLLFDARGAHQRPINGRPFSGQHGTLHKLNLDAMMLGDSLLGMRAFDALRVLEYAHRIAPRVEVAGEGGAGLALLLAAYLDGGVVRGRFTGLPRSWAEWVQERYLEPDYTLEAFGLVSAAQGLCAGASGLQSQGSSAPVAGPA